jgi:hypothetical protein
MSDLTECICFRSLKHNYKYSIIRIMKSRRMGWAGNVARMGGEEERV